MPRLGGAEYHGEVREETGRDDGDKDSRPRRAREGAARSWGSCPTRELETYPTELAEK